MNEDRYRRAWSALEGLSVGDAAGHRSLCALVRLPASVRLRRGSLARRQRPGRPGHDLRHRRGHRRAIRRDCLNPRSLASRPRATSQLDV